MRRMHLWIGAVLLVANLGMTETIISAQDYAVDSDVVLESVVSEVQSIPQDTMNVAGDVVKYVSDEAQTAVDGIKAIGKTDPVEEAQNVAALQTAEAWDSSDDVLFRSYKISSQVGKELMAGGSGDDGAPAVDVSGFFSGVEFADGTSAFYRPEFGRLLVRQTLENVLAIEAVLGEHHNVHRKLLGHQVEIETKFVEVNQKTLNELGFRWTLNKNGGDFGLVNDLSLPGGTELFSSGLRTVSSALNGSASDTVSIFRDGGVDVDLVINALEQSDDTDVLSAPRIVTRNGQRALIQVGEEQMFPESFRVENIDTSPFVEHLDWNQKLMGVQMEVTPTLREGGLIDLKLHPQVVDVIGFDSYRVTPEYRANGIANAPTATAVSFYPADFLKDVTASWFAPTIPEVTGTLPYFRLRELETEVSVSDGSTIGMGGLIYDKLETFRDKVPVLGSIPLVGRLFRSEGERSVKRNLMIFVTATEVDVNGRRRADLVMNP